MLSSLEAEIESCEVIRTVHNESNTYEATPMPDPTWGLPGIWWGGPPSESAVGTPSEHRAGQTSTSLH